MTIYVPEQAKITKYYDAELTWNFLFVFNLISNSKEPIESLEKVDFAGMHEAYEDGPLRAVNWEPGYIMMADALMKVNSETSNLLLRFQRRIYLIYPEEFSEFGKTVCEKLTTCFMVIDLCLHVLRWKFQLMFQHHKSL